MVNIEYSRLFVALGNVLPMKGIKGFALGFSFSLFSMSLAGQLFPFSSKNEHPSIIPGSIKIDLFRPTSETGMVKAAIQLPNIQKETLFAAQTAPQHTSEEKFTALLPQELSLPLSSPTDKLPADDLNGLEIAYAPEENINGTEDAEILAVNIDSDIIPIDFETTTPVSDVEIAHSEDDSKVALLPTDTLNDTTEDFEDDSPWVIARGNKHIKNKKLLEKFQDKAPQNLFTDSNKEFAAADGDISYKVAERIKQSIIFPIPDEILNDENLTPTFITGKTPKAAQQGKTKPTKSNPSRKETTSSSDEKQLKILSKQQIASSDKKDAGFLGSLSSWFTNKEEPVPAEKPKGKKTFSYSSQGEKPKATPDIAQENSSNDALVSFYETLQETKEEQSRHKILPSELKLSFQDGRAEISGQTLRWLKAFSEKAKEGSTYLQVRLDATAPIGLQRKRLSLLYTIFMNNGVDFKKIDTVFSLTEPNAFVIRTLQLKPDNKPSGSTVNKNVL